MYLVYGSRTHGNKQENWSTLDFLVDHGCVLRYYCCQYHGSQIYVFPAYPKLASSARFLIIILLYWYSSLDIRSGVLFLLDEASLDPEKMPSVAIALNVNHLPNAVNFGCCDIFKVSQLRLLLL